MVVYRVSSVVPAQRRVLVVDDDQDIREMYAESLALNGYEALVAADGQAAVAIAHGASLAAIILDLEMPIMGGQRTIEVLKSDPRTAPVPIIVVTGSVRAGAQNSILGCDVVLTKPCPPDAVVLALEHVLRGEVVPKLPFAFGA